MKDFTFPVNNVFLEIECNILCNAKILHGVRHHSSDLIAYPEEMINPVLLVKTTAVKSSMLIFC